MTSEQGQLDERRVQSRLQQIFRLERKLARNQKLHISRTTTHCKLRLELLLERLRENLHSPKNSRQRARERNRTPITSRHPAQPPVIDRVPWRGLWSE